MEQRLGAAIQELGWTLQSVRPLHGGACQENFLVTCDGGRLVLRSDANQSLPGSLGRAQEAEIIQVAVRGGVPTPAVRSVLPDLLRPGSTAVLMDFAEGIAIGALTGASKAILMASPPVAMSTRLATKLTWPSRAPVSPASCMTTG